MALGDNALDVSSSIAAGFNEESVSVLITPSAAAQNVPRDKFGRPLQAATPTTVNILVSKAKEDMSPTAAGGKPVEVLEFYALPGTVHENDEITWNAHVFRTTSVWPFGLGGMTHLEACLAQREVDL